MVEPSRKFYSVSRHLDECEKRSPKSRACVEKLPASPTCTDKLDGWFRNDKSHYRVSSAQLLSVMSPTASSASLGDVCEGRRASESSWRFVVVIGLLFPVLATIVGKYAAK